MNIVDMVVSFIEKVAYWAIMVIFVIIIEVACYCIVKMIFPCVCIGNFSEWITAIVALLALIITVLEYYWGKDAKQAQVLSEYNKRYSEDPNIIKVVKYLNYIDEGGTINNPKREKPSNYEVEMFMRYFEELELQIKSKRLYENDVFNLFCYYANIIDEKEELRIHLGISNEDYSNYWDGYKRLMEKYRKSQKDK